MYKQIPCIRVYIALNIGHKAVTRFWCFNIYNLQVRDFNTLIKPLYDRAQLLSIHFRCTKEHEKSRYLPATPMTWQLVFDIWPYAYMPSLLLRKKNIRMGFTPCDSLLPCDKSTGFLTEANFGLRVLSLPACVCVCACPCVHQSRVCPRDNSSTV